MNRILKNVLISSAVACVLAGCDQTESHVDENRILNREGFIRGTVQTTLRDGRPISHDFDYRFKPGATANDSATTDGYITLERYENMEGLLTGRGNAFLEFQLTDSLPLLTFVSVVYTAHIERDTIFYSYVIDNRNNATEMRMTEFDYDRAHQRMSGRFIVTSASTFSGNSATLNGSFETHVTIPTP